MGDLFMGISRKLVSEVKHMRDGLFTCVFCRNLVRFRVFMPLRFQSSGISRLGRKV